MSVSAKPYTIYIYPTAGEETRLLEKIHGDQTATIKGKNEFYNGLISTLSAISAGSFPAALMIVPCGDSAGVRASATLTFSGLPVADEVFSVAGTVFTAKASGATGNQFNIGADATATATAVAAAVNASATALVARMIVATSSGPVVTIGAQIPGVLGNAFQVAQSMTNCALGVAANGCLQGGLDTVQTLQSNITIA